MQERRGETLRGVSEGLMRSVNESLHFSRSGEAYGYVERRVRAAVAQGPLAAFGREAGDVNPGRRRGGQRRSVGRRRGRTLSSGSSARRKARGQVCMSVRARVRCRRRSKE
jgi:hypothetical protein